ncbi:hypothetical protein [Phenylobacterium sp.]|uniref:hypothetical protein n=1 Tax=Phenylobacterium sp. TaxID=1871053 RepID=UPI00271E3175|nr:hypothetical protein [Phenylobacterium sp.]MDO8802365.1 hypothetical protein [Phenylobacterium sp.]
MSTSHLLAAAAASAFVFAGLPAQAQYRASPQQSLSGSCQDVQTLNSGYVTAECRDNQGRYRWSSIYYPYCRSDVANRDGVMSCVGAEATAGGYAQPRSAGAAPVAAIIGAIANALINGNDDDQSSWSNIDQRQANLDARIDAGVRDRSLTAREADQLRSEFQGLVRMEADYRRGGLTNAERADLDRRFDLLSSRIQSNRQDGDTGWTDINRRQANLDARIDAGLLDRSLTTNEAARLRSDFQGLMQLEASYRRGGLTNSERADLDRRFDMLSARVQASRQDDETGWTNINQRQANLEARIEAGLRDRSLTASEAAALRRDLRTLARLETKYRRGGLTMTERADLDRRFDRLSVRVKSERRDR